MSIPFSIHPLPPFLPPVLPSFYHPSIHTPHSHPTPPHRTQSSANPLQVRMFHDVDTRTLQRRHVDGKAL